MSEASSLTGRLLVAMPGIGDPRFEHAVILICAHGPDHAMGLRLDRPAPGVDLKAEAGGLGVRLIPEAGGPGAEGTAVNVALPSMQADLGASADTINWVLTSYIVAAAIVTALTGWMADRLGRKRLFLISVAGFVAASVACGLSWSLGSMVAFRVLQGVFGAAIVPLAQTFMLDINPREKQGQAMALWGAGIMVGPIIGPTLGGWLTESFNWRWVFFINLPIAALSGGIGLVFTGSPEVAALVQPALLVLAARKLVPCAPRRVAARVDALQLLPGDGAAVGGPLTAAPGIAVITMSEADTASC